MLFLLLSRCAACRCLHNSELQACGKFRTVPPMKGLVTAFFCLIVVAVFAAPAPDFDTAHKEAIEILSGFIKVDTVNPPGNETRGAEFLKGYLDKAGISSEILELEPRRGNLVARIKGNGKKKPLLLMGHLDVVGVEREKWSVDPLSLIHI